MSEPPITVRAKNDSGPGNITPTRVVVHTTSPVVGYPKASQAGMAASTARYFASGATVGSAHYVVDVAGEQHCVPDAVVANHAPPNGHSIGIEICAEGGTYPQSYTREQWLSPQVWPAVLNAAKRCRELCQRFGIPMVRLSVQDLLLGKHGVCGHVDVSNAWHMSTHSDPGGGFPWPEFMQAVNSPTPVAPTTSQPSRGDDPVAPIPITPNTDGTFRASVMAEAGSSSAVVAAAWITYGSTWGDSTFTITTLDTTGKVLSRTQGQKVPNNTTGFVQVPSGCALATIEGSCAPGAVPVAALVCKAA